MPAGGAGGRDVRGPLMSSSPRERYAAAIAGGWMRPDPGQARAVDAFEALYRALGEHPRRLLSPAVSSPLRYFRRGRRPPRAVRGLYLWGGVGRGKTMLMDDFFAALDGPAKRRTHFHRFMQSVHEALERLRERRTEDPLGVVAADWAAEVRVLGLDEFHVRDIADAMLLGRLLKGLFDQGVTLVTTSNVPPARLYEGGLQRGRFLPAIAEIEARLTVLELAGTEDHRLRALERADVYYSPLGPAAAAGIEACFDRLVPNGAARSGPLTILGRPIATVRRSEGVVWFRFDQLCDGPRGTADYIEIARCFHTVLLSDVPVIAPRSRDRVRRFISLVDELYDRNVNLVTSAAAPPARLYPEGRDAFEFERTRSRLEEMQTRRYLHREHLG